MNKVEFDLQAHQLRIDILTYAEKAYQDINKHINLVAENLRRIEKEFELLDVSATSCTITQSTSIRVCKAYCLNTWEIAPNFVIMLEYSCAIKLAISDLFNGINRRADINPFDSAADIYSNVLHDTPNHKAYIECKVLSNDYLHTLSSAKLRLLNMPKFTDSICKEIQESNEIQAIKDMYVNLG